MKRKLEIHSYFSIPVDLAVEFSHWKEFVSGSGYDTNWLDSESAEKVTTKLVEKTEKEEAYVVIESNDPADLMHKVSGAVINLLSKRSDNLMIY